MQPFQRNLQKTLHLSILVCSMLFPAMGQVDRSGIVGLVTDASGASIAGAQVKVTNTATGQATEIRSDEGGRYSAPLLRVGVYTVAAEHPGFSRTVQSNVAVEVGQFATANLTLSVGAPTTQVDVTAAPPLVDTQSGSLGTVESGKRVMELPLNGRNFVQLAYLSAGANDGQSGGNLRQGTVENPRSQQRLSVNGLRTANNNWLLDGVDNTQLSNGGLIIMPPPDAIQEFRIEENAMSAEYGRGGSAINVVLKSGTNVLHGGAFGFIRNDALDARNFFDVNKAPLRQNQDGFYLGGPVKKNRLFLFGDYQTTHIRKGQTYSSTVPTAKMRNGDFSELGVPLYDPLTTDPVTGARTLLNPGNPYVVPASRIDPIGQKLLNYYPLPNQPGLTGNYVISPARPLNENSFDTRVDYAVTSRDQLFGHYSFDKVFVFQPAELGDRGGSNNNHAGPITNKYQHAAAGWTHTFGSSLLNDLHGGYYQPNVVGLGQGQGKNMSQAFGIPNSNRNYDSSQFVGIHPNNYQGIGDTEFSPERIAENLFQIADTVSWTRGKQHVNFGGDFRRQILNFFQLQAAQGEMSFSGQYTGNLAAGQAGNSLADMLLGIAATKYQDTAPGPWPTRYWDFGTFFQDDIRLTNKLTINLGLRYSIQSPPDGKIGNFQLDTLKVVNSWGPNAEPYAGIKFDKTNFAPRIGVAWTPFNDKTVVRAGFGIFYGTDGSSFDDLGLNPPNIGIYTATFNARDLPQASQFIGAGFPATIAAADPNVPSGDVRATGTTRLVPRIIEYNVNIQRQLGRDWVLQAAYVGTRGDRLWNHQVGDLNQPTQLLDTNFQNGTEFGRKYYSQLPKLNTIYPLDMSMFYLRYNALQTGITKRFSQGLNVDVHYTFAKNLGTADGLVGGNVQNIYDVNASRGPVQPDIRHRLVGSYLYELPFGKGRRYLSHAPRAVDTVLGGWQTTGIFTAQSGSAYTPTLSSDLTNTGSPSPRPDLIHNPYDFSFNIPGQQALGCPGGYQTLQCWFNPAAFVLPQLAPGQKSARQYGNAGTGTLRGPDLVDFDFGGIKNFRLTERQTLQFRAELFNLANHPNFAASGGRVNARGGQRISSTIPDNQREVQLALKWMF